MCIRDRGKKSRKKGGALLLFGIGAAAAAVVAVVMSRKPKDDPWAAPVTETAYLPPSSGRASTFDLSLIHISLE